MELPRIPQRTTTGFAFSMVERAIKEACGRRELGRAEIREIINYFCKEELQCVYCGSPEVKRWDHLLPIGKGGETVLGNIVPSCQRCDDSKRDEYFEDWIKSDTKCSPKSRGVRDIDERIRKIKAYMKKYGYHAETLEEKLTEEERKQLDRIRSDLNKVRRAIESFGEAYKLRIGN
jgi:hypothetical protein